MSCVVAALGFWLVVGFPSDKHIGWNFLNRQELDFVIAKIDADRGDARDHEKFSVMKYLRHGTDLKIWGYAIIFCLNLVVAYAFAFFLPIILQLGMGVSTR
jgi:hypothetical protein